MVTPHDFAEFRVHARALAAADVAPAAVVWRDPTDNQASLFGESADTVVPPAAESGGLRVPRRYVELAEIAALYRKPDRFALLYRVLYRLTHGEPHLLEDEVDDDTRALALRVQSVRKDEHRMHAFVRFRKLTLDGADRYVAWFAPEHHIVRLAAPFFQRRFANMVWSILTPDESAHWDGATLVYGPGAPRAAAPDADQLEELFRTYYGATYNPSRANLSLFRKHITPAYARHMPELNQMPALLQAATARGTDLEHDSAAPLVPPGADLGQLRAAAVGCRACPACELGSQVVFGEGPSDASLCLVGEQPGDEEDRQGRVFVGPAGQVLDRALKEAGVAREGLYVTNAVKHFSFIYRGKRRLHQKPHLRVVQACKPWLEAEVQALAPRTILCLGSTAAQSFLGPRFSVTRNRGRVFETPWAASFIVTYHPSAILRMEREPAEAAYRDLVADLTLAQSHATGAR
ncbi:MAG: UdgX family uracil-DNA binding protein [Polyangiales bacterium]